MPKSGKDSGHDSDAEGDLVKEIDGIEKILNKLARMDYSFSELKNEVREKFQSTEFRCSTIEEKAEETRLICESSKEKIQGLTDASVVGFKEHSNKIQIYKPLSNLKGLEKWDRVYVSDDLTECQ